MSCTCTKKLNSYHPTEYCVACATKHIATAIALQGCDRLAIAGELLLQQRHLAADTIAVQQLEGQLEAPDPQVLVALQQNLKPLPNPRKQQIKLPLVHYPRQGIRHFAAAWAMLRESGYEEANRIAVIGDLALQQFHIYEVDWDLAVKLRDVRHMVEERRPRDAEHACQRLCSDVHALTEKLKQEIAK